MRASEAACANMESYFRLMSSAVGPFNDGTSDSKTIMRVKSRAAGTMFQFCDLTQTMCGTGNRGIQSATENSTGING